MFAWPGVDEAPEPVGAGGVDGGAVGVLLEFVDGVVLGVADASGVGMVAVGVDGFEVGVGVPDGVAAGIDGSVVAPP